MTLAQLKRNAERRKGVLPHERARTLPPHVRALCWWLRPAERVPWFTGADEERALWCYELCRFGCPQAKLAEPWELDGLTLANLFRDLGERDRPGWVITSARRPLYSAPSAGLVQYRLDQSAKAARVARENAIQLLRLVDGMTRAQFLEWFARQQHNAKVRAPWRLEGRRNRPESWQQVEALVAAQFKDRQTKLSGAERFIRHAARQTAKKFLPLVVGSLKLTAELHRRGFPRSTHNVLAFRLAVNS